MNRKQFQEWLDQFPEETIIEVAVQQSAPSYFPYGEVKFEIFSDDPYVTYEYTDFTNNKFAKETDEYYGRKYLQLGSGR